MSKIGFKIEEDSIPVAGQLDDIEDRIDEIAERMD